MCQELLKEDTTLPAENQWKVFQGQYEQFQNMGKSEAS